MAGNKADMNAKQSPAQLPARFFRFFSSKTVVLPRLTSYFVQVFRWWSRAKLAAGPRPASWITMSPQTTPPAKPPPPPLHPFKLFRGEYLYSPSSCVQFIVFSRVRSCPDGRRISYVRRIRYSGDATARKSGEKSLENLESNHATHTNLTSAHRKYTHTHTHTSDKHFRV